MEKDKLRKIYRCLPFYATIDKVYCAIPKKIKNGKVYREKVKLLENSQWWSADKLEKYQLAELKKVLVHAYENTKYYHRVFEEVGFNPYNFSKFSDMEVVPFLDKKIIRENFDDMIADNIPKSEMCNRSTGGTSGDQLHFVALKNTYQTEMPFVESIWQRVGFRYDKDLLAVLRNNLFEENEWFRMEYRHNKIIFNNYHLNDEGINRILTKMAECRVKYLHTYPSAAYSLAEYVCRSKKKFNLELVAILATSENIYPGQKEYIEKYLGGRVFTFFGHSERACIAGWCEKSDKYHLNSEYGYTELIDSEGKVVRAVETQGEIVCTGFGNYAMPFIRYKTGDYSSYCANQRCECGRHYGLLNDIQGRWLQEMVIRIDGSKVSITALNMHSQIFSNVKNYQMIQNRAGALHIQIVKADNYCSKDERAIIKAFKEKLGSDFDIMIQYVEQVDKTKIGKQRYLIQNIK